MKKIQKTDPIITRAMAFCAGALSSGQKDPDILLLRGIIYLTSDQPKSAVIDFTNVIEQVPVNEKSYYLRSRAYYEMDEFDLALKDYFRALREGDKKAYAYSDGQIHEMISGQADVKEINSVTKQELNNTLVLLAQKYENSPAVKDLFKFHVI